MTRYILYVLFALLPVLGRGQTEVKKEGSRAYASEGNRMLYYHDGNVAEWSTDLRSADVKMIVWQNTAIGAVPEEVYKCTRLQTLDLSHNAIKRLDVSGLQKMKSLRELYLNGNPISDDELTKIRQALPGVKVIVSKEE